LPIVTAVRGRSGWPAFRAEEAHPRGEALLVLDAREGDRPDRLLAHAGDRAGQQPAGRQLDADVGRRRGLLAQVAPRGGDELVDGRHEPGDDGLAEEPRRQQAAGDLRPVGGARVAPGQACVEQPLADAPLLEVVECDRQAVGDLRSILAQPHAEADAEERADGMLDEAHEVVELDDAVLHRRQRRREERGRGGAVGAQGARPGERGVVEAPRPVAGEHAGTEVARVEGLQRMADEDAAARGLAVLGAHRAVDDVEQLADRDGRRALGVRALVVAV
jgi:hypothetical protein